MLEKDHPEISLKVQADLLGMSYSSLFYEPAPPSARELAIKRRIDKIYTDCPFYGSRKIAYLLGPEFGVSLQIKAGEIYGLVGSDGAGKTTTLRLLVGALKADAGEISICGYDLSKHVEQARSQFGYLSQRFSLYEDLTVLENIRFFAEARGLKSNEWLPRCNEILEFVGLERFKDRRAGQLSGGMKQKLGLASALVTRPRVLLLDEPTTGVDPTARRAFWDLIYELAESGVTILVTTHYMDEAEYCERVGIMRDGKLLAMDTPSNLKETIIPGDVWEVYAEPLQDGLAVLPDVEGVLRVGLAGDHLRTITEKGLKKEVLLKALKAKNVHVSDVVGGEATLEDVFISLAR